MKFNDVADDYWAKEYIDYLSARNIIAGKGNNMFAPNDTVTRAEFVKILAGVAGADVSKETTAAFSDVAADAWYTPYVAWAYNANVAKGSDEKFYPNAQISRQEMATMLYRFACDIMNKQLPDKVPTADFADNDQIADYAKVAVKELQESGIIGGKENNMFAPNDFATRAEASKMISLFMQL